MFDTSLKLLNIKFASSSDRMYLVALVINARHMA